MTRRKTKKPRTKGQKVALTLIIIVFVLLLAGVAVILWLTFFKPHDDTTNGNRVNFSDPIYSTLTGLEISDASLNHAPTYCVQIPNGNDGGRPQAGLNQAAVVFEAIAEAGITRFAAVFQSPTVGAIGPIRSLRPYYLDWDTPFNCTVVHAGGSDEALDALSRGGQRELDENESYMWREQGSNRMWNNLFTSPNNLAQYNANQGYNTSNIKTFSRLTPNQVEDILTERDACDDPDGLCVPNIVDTINLRFGASPTFNTTYHYNPTSNTYLRFYANGEAHVSYECPAALSQPNTKTQCGDPILLAPSVVIAMVVQERNMSDNYHQSITTIGTGPATIFQNGQAIDGTWTKTSQASQIVFRDNFGNEIALTPGQVWIAAIPQYGSIEY